MKSALMGGVAIVAFWAVPAMGQKASDEAASASDNSAQEIIVTARRRQESILKVPVVATVLGSKELTQRGIGDLSGITSQVPGLDFGSTVSSFGNQVSMRGIGTATLNAANDQSVSLNIDGMQITQGLSYQMGFFDMAHIEVLKGPQALFFGKASPAGVISVRSADPTNDLEVTARAGYEIESREKMGELILSGPLTQTLSARMAAHYSASSGYFRNAGTPGDLGTLPGPLAAFGPLGSLGGVAPDRNRVPLVKNLMLRGTLVWEPTSDFKARFKINYADMISSGAGFDVHISSCPDGTAPTNSAGVRFLSPNEPCAPSRTVYTIDMDPSAFPGIYRDGRSYNQTAQGFSTLELSYNVAPNLALSSLTGYLHLKQRYMTNGSTSSFAAPPFVVQGSYERKDFTQEVRLTSDYSTPVNFLVGAFYQKAKQHVYTDVIANQRLGELFGFFANLPASLADPHGYNVFPPTLSNGTHDMDVEAISGFGQVLWKMVPDLELGVGARWTDERRSDIQTAFFPVTAVTPLAVPRISSQNLSPEISLTYTPLDTLTIFASLKQAYKSGSFMTSGVFAPGEDTAYHDERVRGGELGIKSELMDRQLRVNIAGYYYRYKGLQVGSNELSPSGNITIYTRNAAGAKSYGVDFDTQFRPRAVPGLDLSGGISWNISRYTDFIDAPCWGGQTVAQGCSLLPEATANGGLGGYTAQDLSGKSLIRAPEWSMNFNGQYSTAVGGGMSMSFGAGVKYSSDYFNNITLRSDMSQPAYAKINANWSLSGPGDRWEIALIGKNLTDKLVAGNCVNGSYTDGSGRISGSITGRGDATYPTVANPAGVEELDCGIDVGRSVQARLTLKF